MRYVTFNPFDTHTVEELRQFSQDIYYTDEAFQEVLIDELRKGFGALDIQKQEDKLCLDVFMTKILVGEYVMQHWGKFRKQIPDYIRRCFDWRVKGEFWELYCDEYADKDEED